MPCGERVKEGTVVGLEHIDAEAWPARAGVDGVVIAQAWGARIWQSQHVVVTGRILPWLE